MCVPSKYARHAFVMDVERFVSRLLKFMGLSSHFEVVTYFDQNPSLVKIFRLDPNGKPIYKGSLSIGFQMIEIRISIPMQEQSLFVIKYFNEKGHIRNIQRIAYNLSQLKEDIKTSLEDSISLYGANLLNELIRI